MRRDLSALSDFLNESFKEQRRTRGREKLSISTWSKEIGVVYTTFKGWMDGLHPPSGDNLIMAADYFGPVIYDLIGLPRPDGRISELHAQYAAVPEDKKDDYINWGDQYLIEHGYKKKSQISKM